MMQNLVYRTIAGKRVQTFKNFVYNLSVRLVAQAYI